MALVSEWVSDKYQQEMETRKIQMEVLKLKSTLIEMKISVDGFIEEGRKRIQWSQRKINKNFLILKTEKIIEVKWIESQDLKDNITQSNIGNTGIAKKEKFDKETEKLFER